MSITPGPSRHSAGYVLDAAGNETPNAKWLCECVCGRQKEVTGGNLRTGRSKSCGCVVTRYEDLTGRVIDDVTVIGYPIRSKRVSASGKVYPKVTWLVACHCGHIKRLTTAFLKKPQSNHSCSYGNCKKPSAEQETIDKNVQEFLKKEAAEAGISIDIYLQQWEN